MGQVLFTLEWVTSGVGGVPQVKMIDPVELTLTIVEVISPEAEVSTSLTAVEEGRGEDFSKSSITSSAALLLRHEKKRKNLLFFRVLPILNLSWVDWKCNLGSDPLKGSFNLYF